MRVRVVFNAAPTYDRVKVYTVRELNIVINFLLDFKKGEGTQIELSLVMSIDYRTIGDGYTIIV